jgi:hypothetical protein
MISVQPHSLSEAIFVARAERETLLHNSAFPFLIDRFSSSKRGSRSRPAFAVSANEVQSGPAHRLSGRVSCPTAPRVLPERLAAARPKD